MTYVSRSKSYTTETRLLAVAHQTFGVPVSRMRKSGTGQPRLMLTNLMATGVLESILLPE